MVTEKRFITVKTQFEGQHLWADAPEEVIYLRSYHRHMFHVEATISVNHDDRELEFIMVKHRLNEIVDLYKEAKLADVDNIEEKVNLGSCEMMAEYIIDKLHNLYGNRYFEVVVSEDGENGGKVIVDYREVD